MTDPNPQDPFEVPEGYTGDIGNPLDTEGIRLPFLAPNVWWFNGRNQFKKENDQRYFGAWSMNDDDMAAAMQEAGVSQPPLGWVPFDMVNDDGDNYNAFLNRFICIAIFGSRKTWDKKENKGRYQVLGYLAYPDQDRKITPFGPVVLTCKSMASKFLQDAVVDFQTKTQTARRKFANNLPISAFYALLGTWGNQRVEQTVGKGANQKKVTPLRLYLPEQIDEQFLRTYFVGKEIAAKTAALKKEAREWLDAWKQPQEPAASNGRDVPQADLVADHMPEMPSEPPLDEEPPY